MSNAAQGPQAVAPQYSCPNCGCTKARDYTGGGERECSGCGRDADPVKFNFRAMFSPEDAYPDSVWDADREIQLPPKAYGAAVLPDGHNY